MRTVRVTFEQVTLRATKRWTENGKKRQQTKVFMQTINPFNRNADGAVKTRSSAPWLRPGWGRDDSVSSAAPHHGRT
jgi:hypothetical protein